MAQQSSLKEEYSGVVVNLEKSKLSPTNTPVKYDFVAITSNGTIEKAIAQREVENNKLVGVIVEINNSTNEVLVLTKGVFKTTYFNTIDSVNISYGTKLYLSDVSAGKLKTTSPITGVGKCISLMTKRGIYVDAVAVQEVFMNQSSYDAIKGNLDSFSFINNKLLSLESLVNNFDLNFLSSQVDDIKNNLKNFVPTSLLTSINYTSASGSVLIPSGLPVGTKKLIRKLNSSQGTVTVTCTGETFTSSNLASVTLNSDGDFWLVEKVNATRWDLVDGKESGSNANGKWYKLYNGRIEARRNMPQVTTNVDGVFFLGMPIQPLSGASVHSRTFLKSHTDNLIAANNILIAPWANINTDWGVFCAYRISDGTRISNTTIPFGVSHIDEVVCESMWY